MSELRVTCHKGGEYFVMDLPYQYHQVYKGWDVFTEKNTGIIFRVCALPEREVEELLPINKAGTSNFDSLSAYLELDTEEELFKIAMDLLKFEFDRKSAHQKSLFIQKVITELKTPSTQLPF